MLFLQTLPSFLPRRPSTGNGHEVEEQNEHDERHGGEHAVYRVGVYRKLRVHEPVPEGEQNPAGHQRSEKVAVCPTEILVAVQHHAHQGKDCSNP